MMQYTEVLLVVALISISLALKHMTDFFVMTYQGCCDFYGSERVQNFSHAVLIVFKTSLESFVWVCGTIRFAFDNNTLPGLNTIDIIHANESDDEVLLRHASLGQLTAEWYRRKAEIYLREEALYQERPAINNLCKGITLLRQPLFSKVNLSPYPKRVGRFDRLVDGLHLRKKRHPASRKVISPPS